MDEYVWRPASIQILCVALVFLLALWACPRIANSCHEFSEWILDWHIGSYLDRSEALEREYYSINQEHDSIERDHLVITDKNERVVEQWENFTGPAWPVLYEAMVDDTREVARLSQANLARLEESIKRHRALEEKKFLLGQNCRILLAHIRLCSFLEYWLSEADWEPFADYL